MRSNGNPYPASWAGVFSCPKQGREKISNTAVDEWIEKALEKAPPLTEDKRSKITGMFAAGHEPAFFMPNQLASGGNRGGGDTCADTISSPKNKPQNG